MQVEKSTQPESEGDRRATYVYTMEVLTKKRTVQDVRADAGGSEFPRVTSVPDPVLPSRYVRWPRPPGPGLVAQPAAVSPRGATR